MGKERTILVRFLCAAFILLVAYLPANAGIVYVKATATGLNNGSSWSNAYTDLQSALGPAVSGTWIWVAAGTYQPTLGSDRTATFRLKTGVALYGGFAGTETMLSQRNLAANATILSGDIGVAGLSADNSYHVVTSDSTISPAVLDGFTVTAGNAGSVGGGGGGMHNHEGSPTLTNVLFYANSAANGGGMFNRGNWGNPTLTNVVFYANLASEFGGGMVNCESASPTLVNVTFSANVCLYRGGGLGNSVAGECTLKNVILWENFAQDGYPEVANVATVPIISYSLIEGCGGSGGGWDQSLGVDGGHNLDADPLFVDAENGNLRLNGHSPAVNAGNTVALPPGVTTDLDGHDRVVAGIVDMGAYEVQAEDLVGIKTDQVPQPFRIDSVAPNPFNPSTTVHFTLPAAMPVTAGIWSVTGARVRVLANGQRFEPGDNRLIWDGRNDQGSPAASGVYFVRIETRLGAKVTRAVLLK